jgi:pimeloyl-ACP methyl ester carboxylesterase
VGHLLGGTIAARFASERREQLSRLVLVDSFGLSWNRTSPRFALPLLAYIARPTEHTRDRFLAQCFVDFDGLRGQLGERFEPIGEYALEWARNEDREEGSPQPHAGVRNPAHPARCPHADRGAYDTDLGPP